jgi:hypothetical protein
MPLIMRNIRRRSADYMDVVESCRFRQNPRQGLCLGRVESAPPWYETCPYLWGLLPQAGLVRVGASVWATRVNLACAL